MRVSCDWFIYCFCCVRTVTLHVVSMFDVCVMFDSETHHLTDVIHSCRILAPVDLATAR